MLRTLWIIFATLCVALTFGHAETSEEQASKLATQWFHSSSQTERDTLKTDINALSDTSNTARFAAGAIEFVEAFEMLGQDLHRHGYHRIKVLGEIPFLSLPVPENPRPAPLNYAKFRAILKDFQKRLAQAEAKLAQVTAGEPASITLSLAKMRLNIRRQNHFMNEATLLSIASQINRHVHNQYPDPNILDAEQKTTFRFDNADALWLRSYAHFMMAHINFWLAHDFEKSFNASFHTLFPKAGLPLQNQWPMPTLDYGELLETNLFWDMISFVQLVNWPVINIESRQATQAHLLKMIELSRASLQSILAETDHDHEWLPGPQQSERPHFLTGLDVTEEVIAAWNSALDALEPALKGEKLIPHWRFEGAGFDVQAFFNSDKNFDLILLATGQDAVRFMKDGDVVPPEQLKNALRHFYKFHFMNALLWFN